MDDFLKLMEENIKIDVEEELIKDSKDLVMEFKMKEPKDGVFYLKACYTNKEENSKQLLLPLEYKNG